MQAADAAPNRVLLQPWCKPAAVDPIRTLAWEPPYAAGVALKKAHYKDENMKQNALECESLSNGTQSSKPP